MTETHLHDIQTGSVVSVTSNRPQDQRWHNGDQLKSQLLTQLPCLLLCHSLHTHAVLTSLTTHTKINKSSKAATSHVYSKADSEALQSFKTEADQLMELTCMPNLRLPATLQKHCMAARQYLTVHVATLLISLRVSVPILLCVQFTILGA